MSSDSRKERIASAYDRMGKKYLERYPNFDPEHKKLLDVAMSKLPEGARILDLGCGPGVPYTKYMSEKFDTTAVDFSKEQIKLAKINAPRARYTYSDFSDLEFPKGTFDLITAFYSLIHVPVEEQPLIIQKAFDYLKKGGFFLTTLGYREWEGEEKNWLGSKETMLWSHLGGEEGLKMVENAGFEVVETKIERDQDSVEGMHLAVLAKKRGD
jgi:ubiquinone/menaquinone biosynthesis C-methylase UbiE